MNEKNDIIIQLQARVKELEDAMYDSAKSSLNVVRYFKRKCDDK